MPHTLPALVVGLGITLLHSTSALSQATAEKMAELMPPALPNWTATDSRVETINQGPAKGGMASRLYRGPRKAKWVLVRFVQRTPTAFRDAVADPAKYDLELAKIGDRDAAMEETDRGGRLIVVAGKRLAVIKWNARTTIGEALGYVEAIDLDALKKTR